jgi:hypothetical protein
LKAAIKDRTMAEFLGGIFAPGFCHRFTQAKFTPKFCGGVRSRCLWIATIQRHHESEVMTLDIGPVCRPLPGSMLLN